MKSSPKFVWSVNFSVLSLLCSCARTKAGEHQETSEPQPLTSGLELAPIEFGSGAPSGIETLEQSVLDEFDLGSLRVALTAIKTYESFDFEIMGFTDNAECAGHQCVELSLRHAALVRDWLLSHGASDAQLEEPVGHGSSMPIDDNGSESGKARNRRVEITLALPETTASTDLIFPGVFRATSTMKAGRWGRS